MGTGAGDYVTPENLNSVMEFDHVIRVHADGLVTDEPDTHAPELYDDEVSPGWTLLDGYSGQYGYSGPVMHASEYIGGGMAKDILAEPGVYVALVASYTCEEHDEECDCETDEGWAVARKDDELMSECDCSEEYGPCDTHEETVVTREGASLRTADELLSVFVADAVGLGAELSPWGKSTLAEYDSALESNRSGLTMVAWLPEDAHGLADDMGSLVSQVEAVLHTMGYSVYWDDGFRIVRITGGPLA